MSSLLIRGELLLLNLECGEKNKTQLTDTFRDELVKNQVHSQEAEENKLPQVDQVSAGQPEPTCQNRTASKCWMCFILV